MASEHTWQVLGCYRVTPKPHLHWGVGWYIVDPHCPYSSSQTPGTVGPGRPVKGQTGSLWTADGQMEVASQAGAYSSMSEELRGGGGGAALLLQPKWLLGAAAQVWTPKGLWPRRLPTAGRAWPRRGAQAEGTGEGRRSGKDWA